MKTKEELNALKNEVEALNKKLAELTDDEMKQVTGGTIVPDPYWEDDKGSNSLSPKKKSPRPLEGSDPAAAPLQKYKEELME